MKRFVLCLLVLLLLPVVVVAKDDDGRKSEIANDSAHATAVKVIPLDAEVGAKFSVEGPDGKFVPAYYDKGAKKLLVLASVPPCLRHRFLHKSSPEPVRPQSGHHDLSLW